MIIHHPGLLPIFDLEFSINGNVRGKYACVIDISCTITNQMQQYLQICITTDQFLVKSWHESIKYTQIKTSDSANGRRLEIALWFQGHANKRCIGETYLCLSLTNWRPDKP